jgi:Phage integrase family
MCYRGPIRRSFQSFGEDGGDRTAADGFLAQQGVHEGENGHRALAGQASSLGLRPRDIEHRRLDADDLDGQVDGVVVVGQRSNIGLSGCQARGLVHGQAAIGRQGGGRWFHDMRHAFATLLLEAGEEVAVISKMLGHADYSTTVDVYSHLSTERSRVAAARIDALLKHRQTQEIAQ